MLCGLIMAGGKGSRFWPLSTEEKPKQFLNLIGNKTMIQMTVKRIEPIIPMERIFICTCEKYVDIVRKQLPNLPKKNIIIEPEGRNTAACIALSALVIERYFKNSKMIVLPSDHLINDTSKFRKIIKVGENYLDKKLECIVTLGIIPTRSETQYGYIKTTEEKIIENEEYIIDVSKFVEKPNKEKAEKYLKDKNYLWNCGIFMWNTFYIINEIKKYIPNTYEALKEIEEVNEEKLQELINKNYKKTDFISIDYAILEKAKNIKVIPSDIGWDDLGNWISIERYWDKDDSGNVKLGSEIKSINSENNIVFSKEKKILLNNIKNIYVLVKEDCIFIGRKGDLYE